MTDDTDYQKPRHVRILELRLQRLTGLEQEKIADELSGLATEIEDFLGILRSRDRIRSIMREEMLAVREQFATPRRTTIESSSIPIEDLISAKTWSSP